MFLIIYHMQLTGILRVLSSAVDKLWMSKWHMSLRNRSTCVKMLSTITSPNFESKARWSWQVINKKIYLYPKDLTRRCWQVNKHFTSGEYDEVVSRSYQYALDPNVNNTTGWFWQVVEENELLFDLKLTAITGTSLLTIYCKLFLSNKE